MPKIRDDLEGAVHVGGHVLFAGAVVPVGVVVGGWLLDGGPAITPAVVDYSDLKLPQLRALLGERGLDSVGNKPDLIGRLIEDDLHASDAGE